LRASARLAATIAIAILLCAPLHTARAQAVRLAGPAPGIGTGGASVNVQPDGRILVFGGGRASIWNPHTQRWDGDDTAPQAPRQAWHTATTLPDGRIVMIGGLSSDGPPRTQANALALTLFWTPATGVWTEGPSLLKARMAHAAVALPSNEVLVIGGSTSASAGRAFGPFLADAEVVGENTTTARKPMAVARAYHTASLLKDGRVMVIGGTESGGKPLASVEIYDPRQDAWSDGPDLHVARTGHTASVLPDGSVLVVGGVDSDGRLIATAERWNPSDNAWSPAGALAEARGFQQATVLSSGDVLISGGVRTMDRDRPGTPTALLELWQASSSRWRIAGSMPFAPYDHLAARGAGDIVYLFGYNGSHGPTTLAWLPHESESLTVEDIDGSSITRLSDGRFLLAGGGPFKQVTPVAFVYDPNSNRWTSTGPMHWPRTNHKAILLRDGRVLAVGGRVASTDPDPARPSGNSPPSYPAEVWNPDTDTWSSVPALEFPSGETVLPALLPDGRVQLGTVDTSSESVYAFRIWDPHDGSVTSVTELPRPRPGGQAVAYPDGHLLFAGGDDLTQVRKTPGCMDDSDDGSDPADKQGTAKTSDPCTLTLQSAREGRRLDRWDPVTHSWSELPSAPVSLNNTWLFALEDGGVLVLPHPPDWYDRPRTGQLKIDSFLLWQPTWGWRTFPYPASQGQYPAAVPLPKGEVLLRTGFGESWLWSPEAQKWLSVAHDVAWESHGLYLTRDEGVMAFRGRMSMEGLLRQLEVARLNREALRWEAISEGYIPRPRPAPVTLADGRILVVGGESTIVQIWNAKDNSWTSAGYTHNMLRGPKALLLKDGRIMVVGLLEQDSREAVCEVWAPTEDRWTDCGRFTADTNDTRPEKMLLRYLDDDQVLWVQGNERAMIWQPDHDWTATRLTAPANGAIPLTPADGTPFLNPIASVWNPRKNRWDDAADALLLAAHAMPGYRDADGNVTAIWADGRRIVRWNAAKRTLSTFDFPREPHDVTFDALAPTPDGCFVAWSNSLNAYQVRAPQATVFDPEEGKWLGSSKPLSMPANARAATAADGTLLLVGYTRSATTGAGGTLRLRASCSGVEPLDSTELLYLPVSETPAKISPTPTLPAHIPLPQKPQPDWVAKWRAEWVGHWQALREHPWVTGLFGVLIALFSLRYFVDRFGAYTADPELRSRAIKVDIAILAAALPILAVVLGIAISLLQGIVGVTVSILALVSARRLRDHAENLRDKLLSGTSYAIALTTAIAVCGTFVGEQFMRVFKFITDYS
jgi:hypothetical protein